MNSQELERELRRNQDTLASLGLGVLAFCVWTIIKASALFIVRIPKQIESSLDPQYKTMGIVIALIMLVVLIAISFSLRVYIWRSTRPKWRQGSRKGKYLIAVGFLAAVSLFSLVGWVVGVFWPDALKSFGSEDDLMGAVVELTALITLIQMIAAAKRADRITRELESRRG